MRIVFTGPQGTGKTTLVEALSKHEMFKDYYMSAGISRRLAKEGYKINEEGTEETQLAVMAVHSKNAEYKNLIADRCAIDCLCYTIYLFENHKLGEGATDLVEKMHIETERLCKEYDFIFYVPVEIPLVADGNRSSNEKFQTDMGVIFNDTIHFSNNVFGMNVFTLSGSVEERLLQIMKRVYERGEGEGIIT